MKKYLFGVVVIILCIACAVWMHKGCVHEVPMDGVLPKVHQAHTNVQIEQMQPISYTPNTIVVSNGIMVVDTREKVPIHSPEYEPYMHERQKAFAEGADAKVTLHVVNQAGHDVPQADVMMIFAFHSRNKPIFGKTDNKGFFTAEGRLAEEIIYTVDKNGYYNTDTKFWLMDLETRCLKNGRWIPWNPTLQVTLKEIRKPIPMVAKKVEFKVPKNAQTMGFDFLVGDWVPPHGKGITVDMLYLYEEERTDRENYDLKLSVSFPGMNSGSYVKSKEEFSAFISDHEARLDNYSSNMVWRIYRKNGQYVTRDRLTKSDYLVFRTRSRCDEKGNIVSVHYGKIYGPLEGPTGLDRSTDLTYYLNPTPNDRNLEFDGKNNLFNPDGRENWPREP